MTPRDERRRARTPQFRAPSFFREYFCVIGDQKVLVILAFSQYNSFYG
jgi:hypothetical protein